MRAYANPRLPYRLGVLGPPPDDPGINAYKAHLDSLPNDSKNPTFSEWKEAGKPGGPGSRGGKWYHDKKGNIRCGEKPEEKSGAAEPLVGKGGAKFADYSGEQGKLHAMIQGHGYSLGSQLDEGRLAHDAEDGNGHVIVKQDGSWKAYRKDNPGSKEQLAQLWTYTYEGAARRFLTNWLLALRWQRLPAFQKLACTLMQHLDGILNYCHEKVPFGKVEAINGNIRAMLRRGRGYRDHEYLLLKVQKATAALGQLV